MSDASTSYRELLTTLLVERELAGGALPEEEESRYVEQLDSYWWAMSVDEQNEIERIMADGLPVTASLAAVEVDVAVDLGEHRPPRKAA